MSIKRNIFSFSFSLTLRLVEVGARMDSPAMFRMYRNEKGTNAIEISQLVDGMMNKVTISLAEFPHFIFTLKSLHNSLKINMQSQQEAKKRSRDSCEEDGNDISAKKKSVVYEPAILSNNLQLKNDEQYSPVTNFKMDSMFAINTKKEEKPLRERLLDIICQLFCQQYPEIVQMQCSGCLIGTPDVSLHHICSLPRKERIELVFKDVFNNINDDAIKQASGCEHSEYIEKDVLIRNSSWVRKLKNKIDQHL